MASLFALRWLSGSVLEIWTAPAYIFLETNNFLQVSFNCSCIFVSLWVQAQAQLVLISLDHAYCLATLPTIYQNKTIWTVAYKSWRRYSKSMHGHEVTDWTAPLNLFIYLGHLTLIYSIINNRYLNKLLFCCELNNGCFVIKVLNNYGRDFVRNKHIIVMRIHNMSFGWKYS